MRCVNIDFFTRKENELLKKAEQKKTKEDQDAHEMGVSPERLAEIKAYAAKLTKKFPHMSEKRISKKVCEYFKIKLV